MDPSRWNIDTQSIVDRSDPVVHFERDALVYMLLLAAVRVLLEEGTFSPFGGVANADGVHTIGVNTGTDEPDVRNFWPTSSR